MPPAISPNPTLSGQTLLTLMPWSPPSSWLTRIQSRYPDLKIIPKACPNFFGSEVPSDVSDEELSEATIVLTWRIFPERKRVPKLQYVQLSSAGVNHVISNPLYEDGGVVFCTASGVHPPQIAEWVICTFLAHQHQIPMYLDHQRAGDWVQPETDEDVEDAVGLRMTKMETLDMGRTHWVEQKPAISSLGKPNFDLDVHGLVSISPSFNAELTPSNDRGILGYGAIGRQCARLATAMGMSIYAYNLRPRPTAESRRDETYTPRRGLGDPEGVLPEKWFSGDPRTPEGATNFEEFLGSGLDVLVICTPLTNATKGLIGKEQLEVLKKKRTFISNIGRGPIVKTDDLVFALNNGWIRGAALDVTDPEPLPKDHELWKAKNVIITPHVSGNSNAYNERLLGILEYNLDRMSKGEGLTNAVERDVGY